MVTELRHDYSNDDLLSSVQLGVVEVLLPKNQHHQQVIFSSNEQSTVVNQLGLFDGDASAQPPLQPREPHHLRRTPKSGSNTSLKLTK